MKIKSLFYKDNYQGWQFETGFQDFNLLVGISGSGKSQILNAIMALKEIAKGASMNGIEWQIHFEGEDHQEYVWAGAFHTSIKYEKEHKIKHETLFQQNNHRKIERLANGHIRDNEVLNASLLDRTKSLLMLFKDDLFVKNVVANFEKIMLRDYTISQQDRELPFYKFYNLKSRYDDINNLTDLQNLETSISEKLIIAKRKEMPILAEIQSRLTDVFPQIADWVVYLSYDERKTGKRQGSIQYRIKVKNNPKWIQHEQISSGMLRTLNHFIEINLCSDNTVFLIDEFENSLGMNCIDILAEDLIAESMRLQFIITSHHPYIINNIPMENWLVLNRKNGRIFVQKAADLGLGISKHQHYLQLVNSPFYNSIT